jgi:adenosylcobinamide kinase/adenosylcobinamide-phosphate guanylyltransferase
VSLILIGGGVRSGKSAFAIELARKLGQRRAFFATAEAKDGEMRERIERHQIERGNDFVTIEEPLALTKVLHGIANIDVVLIDCLTLWLSNMVVRDCSVSHVEQEVEKLVDVIGKSSFSTIVVTNEVGMGIVPESALGRLFRDLAGHTHQRLASQAERIYLAALGVILRLRPDPVQVIDRKLESIPR